MLKKTMLWSVVLLIGTLSSHVDRAEGVVFGIRPPQTLCSSKLALQVRKWTLSDNDLGYSMKHAVLTNNVGRKHKTTFATISQGLGHTTLVMTEAAALTLEGLGGLVGAYTGHLIGYCISTMVMYALYEVPESEHQARLFAERFIARPVSGLGAATGTSLVGLFFNPKGSFTVALIGSEFGVALATFLQLQYGPSMWWLLYPCAALGAVLGYNLLRGR